MIGRNAGTAKTHMALRAGKRRILFLLIDFEIQDSTVIGGSRDVASVLPAA